MANQTFDYMLINFHEGAQDEVVIRAYIAGGAQRRFAMDMFDVRKPDFMRRAYEIGMATGESIVQATAMACPVCGTRKIINHRMYQGNRFCGLCGTQYRLKDGETTIIATVTDS